MSTLLANLETAHRLIGQQIAELRKTEKPPTKKEISEAEIRAVIRASMDKSNQRKKIK